MKYYRLRLGKSHVHANRCFTENFIGVDFGIAKDFANVLPEDRRAFDAIVLPEYCVVNPEKSKIAAGAACGMLWTVYKEMQIGDIVLCPNGNGSYRIGEIKGDYRYVPGDVLPHRRDTSWLSQGIDSSEMSETLRNSCGIPKTISDISMHHEEIKQLLGCQKPKDYMENQVFALEKQLEDFLVANWTQTELGNNYNIYEEVNGDGIGQQYSTDAGIIDILAISKDRKELLVVELKKGRISDVVVGQILRYMGYVAQKLAEKDQIVKGAIIALEEDSHLQWALAAVPNVSFYRYQVNFKLLSPYSVG